MDIRLHRREKEAFNVEMANCWFGTPYVPEYLINNLQGESTRLHGYLK
jgi:hypothetical protein